MTLPPDKNPLWPHVITALLTILIQVAAVSYVYGQLSALVAIHSKEIEELRQSKLDAAIYYREHPGVPISGAR